MNARDPLRYAKAEIVADVLEHSRFRMARAVTDPDPGWRPMWLNVAVEALKALDAANPAIAEAFQAGFREAERAAARAQAEATPVGAADATEGGA